MWPLAPVMLTLKWFERRDVISPFEPEGFDIFLVTSGPVTDLICEDSTFGGISEGDGPWASESLGNFIIIPNTKKMNYIGTWNINNVIV